MNNSCKKMDLFFKSAIMYWNLSPLLVFVVVFRVQENCLSIQFLFIEFIIKTLLLTFKKKLYQLYMMHVFHNTKQV